MGTDVPYLVSQFGFVIPPSRGGQEEVASQSCIWGG